MTKKMINTCIILHCFAMILVLAGCSSQANPGSNNTGSSTENRNTGSKEHTVGTLTYGLPSDIIAIDPAFAYDYSTLPVVNQVTEGLLKFDKNLKLVGNLAEKWENPDPKTYIYHLRKDVKFQDGSPMTIDDVIFSMERTRDPKTASYVAWMYKNVDKIEKTDDWTVKVTLLQPDAMWRYTVATTACHVISKKYYEEHKETFGKPEGGVMGTGPFKFVSWKTGSEVVLAKNPNYWDKSGGPYLDKVEFKVIPEGTTRITGLKTEQINMMIGLPLELVQVAETLDNVKVEKVDGYMTDSIHFNTKRKPFDDVKVRQALNYALDKQNIMDQIVKSTGIPAKGVPVPPAMWTFATDKWEAAYKELPDYSYNMDKARKLLAESSVPNGFKAKIMVNNTTIYLNAALALQAAVKPLGIDLEIEKVTGEEVDTRLFSGAKDYDISLNRWSSDFPDPAGNLLPVFHSSFTGDGGANFANYSNPEVDKLLAEQSSLSDDERRADMMIQAEKLIAADSIWIVIDHPKQIMATTKSIEGTHISPLWVWDAFLKDVKMQ